MLCMSDFKCITSNMDRPNIFYACIKTNGDVEQTFTWLADELGTQKTSAVKRIVYCRSIQSCAEVFGFFLDTLGEAGYEGESRGYKTRIFAMFHHSTRPEIKQFVTETFCKPESVVRVVIATVAFGLGVDAPDIHTVIHWGAPRSMEGLSQETGRAGRDAKMEAYSIIYHHGHDTSDVATDEATQEFCRNPEQQCRREMLLNYFQQGIQVDEIQSHRCCDVCLSKCSCGNCPEIPGLIPTCAESSDVIECVVRRVSEADLLEVYDAIVYFRRSFIPDPGHSLISPTILTGLSDDVISHICSNLQYTDSAADLLDYGIDSSIAHSIMSIIERICERV